MPPSSLSSCIETQKDLQSLSHNLISLQITAELHTLWTSFCWPSGVWIFTLLLWCASVHWHTHTQCDIPVVGVASSDQAQQCAGSEVKLAWPCGPDRAVKSSRTHHFNISIIRTNMSLQVNNTKGFSSFSEELSWAIQLSFSPQNLKDNQCSALPLYSIPSITCQFWATQPKNVQTLFFSLCLKTLTNVRQWSGRKWYPEYTSILKNVSVCRNSYGRKLWHILRE